MTDISIVTPSYNQGRFIERTIRSVLDQELEGRQLEYLVVDGASADTTLAVLRSFAGRLRWVSEPDRGQAHAINKGLSATRGEVIGWLNSDDIYYPGALRAVCDFLDAHREVDVVYGDANHIDEHDAVLEPYYTESWDVERLKGVCYLCQPAVFFRRRLFERAGGLDERLHFCLDYEYWLRLVHLGARFAYLPQVLAGSRLYPETKTIGGRIPFHAEINDMLRSRLGRVPDRWVFNYAHALLEPTAIKRTQQLRFALAVSVLSVYASLRWNHGLSGELVVTLGRWISGALKTTFQRALAA